MEAILRDGRTILQDGDTAFQNTFFDSEGSAGSESNEDSHSVASIACMICPGVTVHTGRREMNTLESFWPYTAA